MQEIIDKLRAAAQVVPVPLDLPDEDQLLDIEEALPNFATQKPASFLLTVSDLVIGSLEPATAADPHSHTYLADMAASAWEQGLPRHLLPFAKPAAAITASTWKMPWWFGPRRQGNRTRNGMIFGTGRKLSGCPPGGA